MFGCQSGWQKALQKIDKDSFYQNDYQGWELVRETRKEWETEYTVLKKDNDTLKVLFFFEGTKDGKINIGGYSKRYNCNGADTCFLRMYLRDTLFLYSENSKKEKTFEVGEYYYRFSYFKMDTAELNYYSKHEDSLRRVRGNNLPKLPYIKKEQ